MDAMNYDDVDPMPVGLIDRMLNAVHAEMGDAE
jgi:hypothetical protein